MDDLCILSHQPRSSFAQRVPYAAGHNVYQDDGRLQALLLVVQEFSVKTGMKLNPKKCKALTFDYSTKRVIFPADSVKFNGDNPVEVVDNLRILGVQLDRDLTFDSLVQNRRKRGLFAVWGLRRLRGQGVDQEHLLAAYNAYVRSTTEFGLMSASTMLGELQWRRLEAVQSRATKVMMGIPQLAHGDSVPKYCDRLLALGLPQLRTRIDLRFHRFTLQNEFLPRFACHLQPRSDDGPQRRQPRPYATPIPRTERYKNSPFMRMAAILNGLPTLPWQRWDQAVGLQARRNNLN